MSRAIWKGFFCNNVFLKKKLKKHLQLWDKSTCIPSKLIGKYIDIYNGKSFKKIYITREKVGYKFGEFIQTRTKVKNKTLKKI